MFTIERELSCGEEHNARTTGMSGQPLPPSPPPPHDVFAHQVYADRYLELLDSPAELSVANTAPSFTISVQMTSSDFGPYACLIFYDPVATPLTVGELQRQFNGPYSDFTTAQVMRNCVSILALLVLRPMSGRSM